MCVHNHFILQHNSTTDTDGYCTVVCVCEWVGACVHTNSIFKQNINSDTKGVCVEHSLSWASTITVALLDVCLVTLVPHQILQGVGQRLLHLLECFSVRTLLQRTTPLPGRTQTKDIASHTAQCPTFHSMPMAPLPLQRR